MRIGLGIFLIALGLVLALGVRDNLTDFDLSMIGWILAGVGALAIVLSFALSGTRRAAGGHTEIIEHRDGRDLP
ncbi:MAG TPA: DUF6458 family protein [Jiangellaceae bacterium]|nr:DUF6458 family protein [Jiangellaceae bacterium]